MGMTYKIVALKPTATLKEYFDCEDSEPNTVADTIIDDMVFDREDAFRRWCGFPPWLPDEEGFAFRIEKQHLQNARAVLQGLLDRVAKMPFTKDGPARSNYEYNEQTGECEYVYSGSPENVAILKAVNEVLSRNYHFGYFPWEERAAGARRVARVRRVVPVERDGGRRPMSRVKNPERKCRDCGARCEKFARFCKRCWRKRLDAKKESAQ